MKVDRGLLVWAILTYALIALLLLYFRFFPVIVNPVVTNALILSALLFFVVSIVASVLMVRTRADLLLVLPVIALSTFLVRAIPNLRLALPPLHDPYYHFICTENILKYGNLESQVNGWYEYAPLQLHWPDMHLLTVDLNLVAGVDLMDLYRFQEPLIGVAFMLGVFILARAVTKSDRIALMAAIIASFSDVVIFYQAEYHPQGLALVFFTLILFAFLRSRDRATIPFAAVFMILVGSMTLSHHFSSLLMCILAVGAIAVSLIVARMGWFEYTRANFLRDQNTWLLLGVLTLSYHVFVYIAPLKEFISLLLPGISAVASVVAFDLSAPSSYPVALSLLKALKYVAIALAFGFLLFLVARKKMDINKVWLVIVLVPLLAFGALASLIPSAPSDRVLAFAMPLIGVFAGILVISFFNEREAGSWRQTGFAATVVVLLVVSFPVLGGIMNSTSAPAYFLQEDDPNKNYWYDNNLPDMVNYRYSSLWTNMTTSPDSVIGVEFDTKTIMLYFAGVSTQKLHHPPETTDDYYFINPADRPYVLNNVTQFVHAQHVYSSDSITVIKMNLTQSSHDLVYTKERW